jgi:pyruvate formate lyase activating enzyme
LTLLPYIDALNIDLKSANPKFYENIGGGLDAVRRTVRLASAVCHVEVTTLVIPGENDSEDEIAETAVFLSSVDKNIPFHVSRFFPRYKYGGKPPTDIGKIRALAEVARKSLTYVYTGNC